MALSVSQVDRIDEPEAEPVAGEIVELESRARARWSITPAERAELKRRVLKLAHAGDTEFIQLKAIQLLRDMAKDDQDDQHHLEGSRLAVTHDHRTPEQVIAALRQAIERKMGRVGAAGRESRLIQADA